ncbi:hypothetical protein, partial [Sphingomonas sp. S2M10]|uniref:hypothetical protein n=1 Tax=Sphingomonas sp. S2M10 TaxID=2705010 RepID=UPI001B3B250C
HLNQQCQRATKIDAAPFPFFQGRPLRLNFGDRRCLSEEHRVGGVASMPDIQTRQHRFAFLWRFVRRSSQKWQKTLVCPGAQQRLA